MTNDKLENRAELAMEAQTVMENAMQWSNIPTGSRPTLTEMERRAIRMAAFILEEEANAHYQYIMERLAQ